MASMTNWEDKEAKFLACHPSVRVSKDTCTGTGVYLTSTWSSPQWNPKQQEMTSGNVVGGLKPQRG